MRGRQVVATYARDTLTSPVKGLEEVISSVRHGSFFPDASRANMFPGSKTGMGTSQQHGDEEARVIVPTPSDSSGVQVIPSGLDGRQADSGSGDVGKTVSASSSSSSSSSDSGPIDDVAERCMPKSLFHEQLEKFSMEGSLQ